MPCLRAWFVFVTLALGPPWAHATEIRVEGTELIVTLDDLGVTRGAAVAGMEVDLPELGTLRLEHAAQDDQARFKGLWLYQAQLRPLGASEFVSLCAPDPHGDTRLALFSGYLDEEQRYIADNARFSLSCTSGVQTKCLRWGYEPWRRAPRTGESLAPYFEACVRMARADYCGDDRPSTRDGTVIDVYDRIGVQERAAGRPELRFEAGWSPQGAVCVHHVRIAENAKLGALREQCSRFALAEMGSACTESSATQHGALLFNRSRP